MKPDTFTLTEQHLVLLRAMCIGWQDAEYGAPEVDPKRPYGNSGVEADLAELLPGLDLDTLRRLHRETATALQIILVTGAFVPGEYQKPKYTKDWQHVG